MTKIKKKKPFIKYILNAWIQSWFERKVAGLHWFEIQMQLGKKFHESVTQIKFACQICDISIQHVTHSFMSKC